MKKFLILISPIAIIIIFCATSIFICEKFISLFPFPGYIPNPQRLELIQKLTDKEIKKIILDGEKRNLLFLSKITKDEIRENYELIQDSLYYFPNKENYKIQSIRLDNIAIEFNLLMLNLSELKTNAEKENALKKYLEVDKLEARYYLLF